MIFLTLEWLNNKGLIPVELVRRVSINLLISYDRIIRGMTSKNYVYMDIIKMHADLIYQLFSDIDLSDPFFDSLKDDYSEFSLWFDKKKITNEKAYVYYDHHMITAFLYLKEEHGLLEDITFYDEYIKQLVVKDLNLLKIGTLKINARGTRLGERFIKKICDHAIGSKYDYAYVTIFKKHSSLIEIMENYGFREVGYKDTKNGRENVYLKSFIHNYSDILENYPRVNIAQKNYWLLSIKPIYHSRLFPDSILHTEKHDMLEDISYTNSIHKIYLSSNFNVLKARIGDILVMYRTNHDGEGSADYKSVATSICIVEEVKKITDFSSKTEFLKYCLNYSIFSLNELEDFWELKKYPFLIRFTYNIALSKRIIRAILADEVGITRGRWTFLSLSYQQFVKILKIGEVNESFIINKAKIR